MSQQQILNKVKKEVKRMTYRDFAKKTGHKSPGTVLYWLRTGKLSKQALNKLTKYFEQQTRNKKGKKWKA